jgi:hypothetical protein
MPLRIGTRLDRHAARRPTARAAIAPVAKAYRNTR